MSLNELAMQYNKDYYHYYYYVAGIRLTLSQYILVHSEQSKIKCHL